MSHVDPPAETVMQGPLLREFAALDPIRLLISKTSSLPASPEEREGRSSGWSQQAALRPRGERDERRLVRRGSGRTRRRNGDGSGSPRGGRAGSGTSPGRLSGRKPRPSGRGTAAIERLAVRVEPARPRAAAVAPVSTIVPRYMTETASATWRTIARSWEMSSSPRPRSRERSTSRFASCACAEASSDASGSSSDDHRRVGRERARDRDPLALAAGELVREPLRRRSTGGRRARRARRTRSACAPRARPRRSPSRDLRADRPPRVERRVRVLEDHLQPDEAPRPRAPRRAASTGSPSKTTLPPDGRHEPDRRARERRLAAARLADEADDLAALDAEARARDRAHAATAAALVVDDDVVELERAHAVRKRVDGTGEPRASRSATSARHLGRGTCRRRTCSAGGTQQPGGMRPGTGGAPRDRRRAACSCAASGCGSASRSARVYGMPRRLQHVVAPTGLDDAAGVEDRHGRRRSTRARRGRA